MDPQPTDSDVKSDLIQNPLSSPTSAKRRAAIEWRGYVLAVITIGVCTAVGEFLLRYFDVLNLVMVYLLGVIFVSTRSDLGPSIAASVLAVLAFDFFMVPPRFTFAVSDLQYLITFVVMLLAAMTISSLTVRNREQASAARLREHRTAALYALSRELASTSSKERIAEIAAKHIRDIFDCQVTILLSQSTGKLATLLDDNQTLATNTEERAVSEWVFAHHRAAGLDTDTLSDAQALYLPLFASQKTIGVMGVHPAQAKPFLSPDRLDLLETIANQTALALERARLVDETQQSRMQIETERLRNSLLSSVSHDLRTPLAAITGASSSLLDAAETIDAESRRELTQTIFDEAERLSRLIRNLVDMTRIESGAIQVKKEWNSLEEVIGTALARLEPRLKSRQVSTRLPSDLLAPFDSVLLEQVFVNLLENAVKYTPPDSPIEIVAEKFPDHVLVQVIDHGQGIPVGLEERIFNKFYRVGGNHNHDGVGLGLTVCRGIVQAHGGRIWVENPVNGGAVFRFTLPIGGKLSEAKANV